MTTEQLQRAIRATPFRPFTIRVADGQQLNVPHPEFITHAPGTRTAAVSIGDGTIEIIDLLLVTGLVTEEQPAASGQG
jgi:hypothetical protein